MRHLCEDRVVFRVNKIWLKILHSALPYFDHVLVEPQLVKVGTTSWCMLYKVKAKTGDISCVLALVESVVVKVDETHTKLVPENLYLCAYVLYLQASADDFS